MTLAPRQAHRRPLAHVNSPFLEQGVGMAASHCSSMGGPVGQPDLPFGGVCFGIWVVQALL